MRLNYFANINFANTLPRKLGESVGIAYFSPKHTGKSNIKAFLYAE